MGVIAIDIDADDLRDLICYLEGDHHMGVYDRQKVVKQLEAAADKRVIVLDVDEYLPLDSDAYRSMARQHPPASHWHDFLNHIADALDSLTPPRPPEPTGFGAVVRDGDGELWTNVGPGVDLKDLMVWEQRDSTVRGYYTDISSGPIEVLNPGVAVDGAS